MRTSLYHRPWVEALIRQPKKLSCSCLLPFYFILLLRVRTERPGRFEVLSKRIVVLRGRRRHVAVGLRITDLVLDPALQRLVVAGASRRKCSNNRHKPAGDQQSAQRDSHIVY